MKKYLIILLLPLLVFTISCEDEINSSGTIFEITDSGGLSNDFVIFIHHSDNPESDALAKVQVEEGGIVTFTKSKIKGGPFVGANTLDIDLSSIGDDFIVTTFVPDDDPNESVIINTYWNVKKGSAWSYSSSMYKDDYDNSDQMISYPNSPTIGSEISAVVFQDLSSGYRTTNAGYYCDGTNEWSSAFANKTYSVNNFNYLIGIELDNGSKFVGTSTVDWETCGVISVDDWIEDGIYDLQIPYTIDYNPYRLSVYNRNYNTDIVGTRRYWDLGGKTLYSDEIGNNGTIDVPTTNPISFADKKYLNIAVRRDDGIFGSSGKAYYNAYTDGEVFDIRHLIFDFDLDSETGDITNISAENEIDVLNFSYSVNNNEYLWNNSVDPKKINQISFPKLDLGIEISSLDWHYLPQATSFDAFDGYNDYIKALREDNTYYSTTLIRRYTYFNYSWDQTSRNNQNKDFKEQNEFIGDLY